MLRRILEYVRYQAIMRDTWRAVYGYLGKNPSARFLEDVHYWAVYCYRAAFDRAEHGQSSGIFAPNEIECGHRGSAADHAEAARARLDFLEALNPALKQKYKNAFPGVRPRRFAVSASRKTGSGGLPVDFLFCRLDRILAITEHICARALVAFHAGR